MRCECNRVTKHCGLIPRPQVAYDYLQHAAAIDIHNHVRTGSVGMENALLTKSPIIRQFSGITGFVFSNAFLAFQFFKNKSCVHSRFKMELANKMVSFKEVSIITRLSVGNNKHSPLSEHKIVKLADIGERKQLRCYYCKHGPRKVRQLTSYYCALCKVPMCSVVSSRSCFLDHIKHGLPNKAYNKKGCNIKKK